VEASDFGQKLIYPENEAAYPDFDNQFLKSIEDYDKITEINPLEGPRMSEHIKLCQLLAERKGHGVPIVAFVFGPLGILSMLRGQSDMYMDLYDDPETVHKALQKITRTLMKYCDSLLKTGIHAIMLDTLFASQSIMSKEMWLEFEGPYVRRLAEFIHSQGKMVMIHNCGNGIYFDAQIETMAPELISYLHIPDDCSSLEDTKNRYGQKTTLAGVISPTWLVSATTEEVEKECRRLIDVFGKDGGFVLATGCEYPANMSLDHAKTICRVAREYNPYQK
jgi:uroporphyrinogen decarboxylase